MTKLVETHQELTAERALAEAIRTFNYREVVRGFSPTQHVLGLAPDETGRFIKHLQGEGTDQLLANPSEDLKHVWSSCVMQNRL